MDVSAAPRVLVLQRGGERHDDVLARVELLPQVADLDERADARAQLVLVDRLVEEVVGAALQSLDLVVGAGQGGEHEDGDGAAARLVLDARAGLVTVHDRHHHVEDDDRRVGPRIELQRLPAVAGDDDLVPPLPEVLFEQLKVLLVVVDGQNDIPLAA